MTTRSLGKAVGTLVVVVVAALGPASLSSSTHAAGLPGAKQADVTAAAGLPGFARKAASGLPG